MRRDDGRNARSRADRIANRCTICGTDMGSDKSVWGLVWASGNHGVCPPCIEYMQSLKTLRKVKPTEISG